ncbi:Stk1 family PASTA domain-containing Ser/Thr kinase [Actinacidiphila rubida]|uniref:Stk1 family PASTA domain-containing Ser/Thr kinase n=1 Tax=Actinacidiphila rubida TaxID=310780 RepID=UPI000849DEEE|nr:Stk1 family PASTA domain-containing Ser/Thr kinase [Actinacidiphila rubida]
MDISVQDPLVGQVLDGRYRVEGRVAVGGMATVYRAVDTRLDRVLALKVMHPALAADTGFVERFIREAKAVARLAHPNVVGVFDQGQDGAYVYLAMEYVAGCTLRDVLKERGALQPRAALDILEPVLAALGAAHRAGLVHRDMKPENVLIGDDGRVKVADFGLVRAVDTQTSASTGALLGTVSYLAPEQIGHGTVDQRSDVYACGLVLYEMLTGRKPYPGDTPMKVIYQHLNEDVPAPSALVPSVAPGLDALVARASARPPQERPADAVEMLAEVRAVRAGLTPDQLDGRPGDPRAAAAFAAGAAGGDDEGTVQMRLRAAAADPVPAGSEELTSVVPLPVTGGTGVAGGTDVTGVAGEHGAAQDPLDRTSRLVMPAPVRDEPEHAAPPVRRGRRGPLALLVALLVVLGVAGGVWYISDGQFTKVPGVLALPQAQAQQKLSSAGLGTKVKQAFSLTVPRGNVISTDPAPGRRVRSNATVTLTVSKGPQVVRVPDVTGKSLDDARRALTSAGLTPGTVTRVFSSDVPNGQVVSTDPAGAADRAPDSPVALTVSRGEPVEVPDVVGDSVADAQQQLEDAGLKVVLAPGKVFSDKADPDSVALESPGAGDQAGTGDTVTLTVSKGQQMVDVPDVKGKHADEAKQILQDAGFDVRVITVFFGDTVFSESPDGGGQAPKGATITLWVR